MTKQEVEPYKYIIAMAWLFVMPAIFVQAFFHPVDQGIQMGLAGIGMFVGMILVGIDCVEDIGADGD